MAIPAAALTYSRFNRCQLLDLYPLSILVVCINIIVFIVLRLKIC